MSVEVLIVGAGQAGLATGWHLKRAGISCRIVEASAHIGGSWRDYYDSLTLFSPAAYSALPGLPFPGNPDRYPARDEVVRYLEQYADALDLRLQTGRRVVNIARIGRTFITQLETGDTIESLAVVAASGAFAQPHTPAIEGLGTYRGKCLHSARYRSPHGFENQRIVVVGGANSAVQIAVELAAVSQVTLATRRPIRFVPQRLLGKDFHFWLRLTGLDRTRWLNDQSTPVLDSGMYRRALAARRPDRRPMFVRALTDGVEWADGTREKVDVLLFATGYRPQVPYLESLGAIRKDGRLHQRNGIGTTVPGLYFVGFPKQRNFASATLRGVGPDAEHVLRHLRAQVRGAV